MSLTHFSSDIDAFVKDIRDAIVAASLNYDIWWVYKSEDSRPKYVSTMNRYTPFFQTSLQAHFLGLLVPLYRIYETRQDTHNIPQLIRRLRAMKALSTAAAMKVDELYGRAKPLWTKVSVLRNDAFGHRSRTRSVADAFQIADMSGNNIKDLILVSQELINTITLDTQGTVHAFNAQASTAIKALLSDLAKSRG